MDIYPARYPQWLSKMHVPSLFKILSPGHAWRVHQNYFEFATIIFELCSNWHIHAELASSAWTIRSHKITPRILCSRSWLECLGIVIFTIIILILLTRCHQSLIQKAKAKVMLGEPLKISFLCWLWSQRGYQDRWPWVEIWNALKLPVFWLLYLYPRCKVGI